ncbi:hypothetical protein [Paenibacillus pectinilyticus]|nr:hypothetical protein [Paenibacillus pectinilyticus]
MRLQSSEEVYEGTLKRTRSLDPTSTGARAADRKDLNWISTMHSFLRPNYGQRNRCESMEGTKDEWNHYAS